MNVLRLVVGLLVSISASAAVGAEACAPAIEKAWVRAAPPGSPSLAGYLVLRNRCAAAVTVVDVESLDFGRPMIHRSVEESGISRMRPAGRLEVPPGGEVRFAPGGLHLMLMAPKRALAEGDRVRIRLVLDDGRRLYAEYPVRRTAP